MRRCIIRVARGKVLKPLSMLYQGCLAAQCFLFDTRLNDKRTYQCQKRTRKVQCPVRDVDHIDGMKSSTRCNEESATNEEMSRDRRPWTHACAQAPSSYDGVNPRVYDTIAWTRLQDIEGCGHIAAPGEIPRSQNHVFSFFILPRVHSPPDAP